ncbi:MAG: BREX system P-loop protein BrxC, partial [Cylindrospermopsis raciborskii]
LTIHIISPFNENAENEDNLRAQSMGRDELVVIIPPEERLMRDLIMYKQTDKYISQNVSITQKDSVKSILTDKNSQNRQRYTDLQQRVHTLLSKSKLILNGSYIEVGGDDPQNRILKGFEDLILKTYPNLQMLRGMVYTEKDLSEALNKPEQLREDTEPEQEVLASIQRNKDLGVRTTLKTLIDKFERKPYGWHHAALLHNVASLCARGKLEVRWDSNLLDGNELLKALTNTRDHVNIILEPQIDFTASQVRALKELYTEFFNEPAPSGDAKLLGQKTATAISDLIDRLEAFDTSHYPFKEKLSSAIARLRTINGKPYAWYLTDLIKQEDELLDLKDQTIDPICTFMNGLQRKIFDSAQAFVKEQEANFWRVNAPQEKKVQEILTDPDCFRGDRMQQLKDLETKLREEITTRVNTEIDDAVAIIESLRSELCAMGEFHTLSTEKQSEIASSFNNHIKIIKEQKLIAVIRDRKSYFEQEEYERLRQIVFCTQPGVVAEKANQYHTNQPKKLVATLVETQTQCISHQSIQLKFDKQWLEDETDVEQYLAAMREALLAEIRSGRRVQL